MRIHAWILATAIVALTIALHAILPGSRLPIADAGGLLQRRPLGAVPSVSVARPSPGGPFFMGRNSVDVPVPEEMDLDTLIRIYQLELSRTALKQATGGRKLRKGDVFGPIPLTPPAGR